MQACRHNVHFDLKLHVRVSGEMQDGNVNLYH